MIRTLRAVDWPQARALMREAFPELDDVSIRCALCDDRIHGAVVMHRRQLAGLIKMSMRADDKVAWIDYVAVAPAARGSGTAQLLMHWAHDHALEWGCRRVELAVFCDNTRAIALYQRLGYRTEPKLEPGERQRMRLDLAAAGAASASLAAAPPRHPVVAAASRLLHMATCAAYEATLALHELLPPWLMH